MCIRENPKGAKAEVIINQLKKSGVEVDDNIKNCFDFLECFECPDHALIAEHDDIWMMLTFQDVVLQSLARPAINSYPSKKFTKIRNTVHAILKRYREVSLSLIPI